MDIKMFNEVIVPLIELETTALICISTPQDSTNIYSLMFDMKDPAGNPLFNQQKIEMVCEDCKRSAHPENCTHMKHLLPRWKSGAKQDMVKQIYGDNATDMLRESMGVTTNDACSVFAQRWIDNFKARPPYSFTNRPKYVFTGCDPNGGGESEMCIFSASMEAGQFIIIGIESHHTKGYGEIRSLLTTHVRALRRVYKSSHFIFIPESNLGHEASHMHHMLTDFVRCTTLLEKGEPGVITTHKRKELYANYAVEQFAGDAIHWARDEEFICMNPFQDANKRSAVVKKKFLQQLGFFNKIVIARGEPEEGNIPKVVYSGKKSGPDDTIMTMVITLYWAMMFMTNRSTPNAQTLNN
jgi:hypothetical protein